MDRNTKELTDFLIGLGIEKIPHTRKSYLGHLLSVYRLMQTQGCDEELCRAGLFHSIYGTQQFQGFKLSMDQRPQLRDLIGARAEHLAYLNCTMQRESFDEALEQSEEPYRFQNRVTGEEVQLNRDDFDDLCRVHLYDWLEQVPRSEMGWNYREHAFRRIVERLGTTARECYDRVFAAAAETGARERTAAVSPPG